MTNIVNFPSLKDRSWNNIESEIISLLKEAEISEAAIKNIINEYKLIFNDLESNAEFVFSLPDEARLSIEQASLVIEEHQKAFQNFMVEYSSYVLNANKHILALLVRIYEK